MPDTAPTPESIERTAELMARARRLLAYGGFDGVVQRPLYWGDEGGASGVFPQFAAQARGCELVDTTGQRFVDWVNGWGPVMLGYRRAEVEEATLAQLAAGPTLSLMHPLEVEVAGLLVEMFPCAEMAAFGKNGSDVLTAAVRVARAVTGRKLVLQYGMHGFHDWYVCLHPQVRGVPEELRAWIHPFEYNDLAGLDALLRRFERQVAAVVMEPVREILPRPGYLEGVRELCRAHGALLVWDEVVTAFRLANGGAQELYGVTPDLACLGKSMANGMPLSALVGKREYMQALPAVGFGMTFRGETLSLAAARAVLTILRAQPVAPQLARIGEEVRARFQELAAARSVRCMLSGPPARMTFVFQDEKGISPDSQRALFLQECLKRGVLTNGNLLASCAHDQAAIERTLSGFAGALDVLAEALRAGRVAVQRPEGGAPLGPRAMISSGFVETLREEAGALHVSGWMLVEDGAPDAVEMVSPSGERAPARRIQRPDVARAFPGVRGAEGSGYAATLAGPGFARGGEYDFEIRALRGGRVAFRCRVVRRRPASPQATVGPFPTNDGVLYV